jgi:tetratricopeptide (TPR) repeat protein
MAMDRVPEAIEKLEKAVGISQDSAVLYFELAGAYALNRDYTKAMSAYHKVVELNPNSTLADRALIEARKIKNRQ